MSRFISEHDLKTFEGWLAYQGYDPEMLDEDRSREVARTLRADQQTARCQGRADEAWSENCR
jgi:hypothetical protein